MKWTYTERDGGEWYFGGNEIVFHPEGTEDFENFAVMDAENKDYACLIAEAPNLLGVALQMNKWIDRIDMSYLTAKEEADYLEFRENLNSAISKSKGEMK